MATISWRDWLRARVHPDQAAPAPRAASWHIRTSLAVLVLACVLPGALTSAWLMVADYQQNKARAIREVISTARAAAANLDRDLASIESGLQVLATSGALGSDDLGAFYNQAAGALPYQNITNYVLIDAQGNQHLNTLRPWGSPLPKIGGPKQLQRIFESKQSYLTDVFIGPVTGKPILALGVPILRNDQVVYSLNAGIVPMRIAAVLKAQRLSPDWISAVLDSQGQIVARSHDMSRFVGQLAVPDLVRASQAQREGVIETVTLDGVPVITAFSRSNLFNWSVAVGIPKAELTQGLKQSLSWLLVITSVLFGGVLWLAWALAVTRVVNPAQRLLTRMGQMSKGQDTGPLDCQHAIHEFALLEQGFADMSERLRQREREREAMLARLTTTLESITDAFYLLDDQWRFVYVNQRAVALLGRPAQHLIGQDHWGVLSLHDGAALRRGFEQAVARRQPAHFEVRWPDLGCWLDVRAYPSDQGLSVYLQDVSELRAARQAREAQEIAEASNKAKTEFLSRMSHELRTPLNAVLGFAQVLKLDRQDTLSERHRAMVDHIESSGQHLLDMISDVLDVSRIESGSMQVLIEDVDIRALMNNCRDMVASDAAHHDLRIMLDVSEDVRLVRADKTRLKQVIINLLSNAIKYNQPGGTVQLSAHLSGSHVVVAVQDTGLGLSPAQLEQLFEPFNRLGREHSGQPGTGIGLVICQRLLALMHAGELTVRSVEAQGSVFSFTLPVG